MYLLNIFWTKIDKLFVQSPVLGFYLDSERISKILKTYTLGCNILYTIDSLWGETTLYTGGVGGAWCRGRAKILVRRGHFYYVLDTNNWADFQNFLIKWGLVTNSESLKQKFPVCTIFYYCK